MRSRRSTFKKIDSNNDGLLSKQEMLNSPGCKFDSEEVDAIFKLGDINGDGELDMGEFIGLMFPPATEVCHLLNILLTYTIHPPVGPTTIYITYPREGYL